MRDDATEILTERATRTPGYTRALRTQSDKMGDLMSIATGIMFDPDDHKTRPEFAEESDVEWIMRHHTSAVGRRQPRYDDIDYSVDLTDAMMAHRAINEMELEAPNELKEKYPDKYSILKGIENGQYEQDLKDLETKKAQERAEEIQKDLSRQTAPPPTNTQFRPAPEPLAEQPKGTQTN